MHKPDLKADKELVAIFGGTFDPPHRGHSHVVYNTIEQFLNISELLLIPCFTPPHRALPTAAYDARCAMLNSCFRPFWGLNTAITVSTIESTLSGPSYTVHTLEALRAIGYPEHTHQFILILG
ncbi:MAG: nicotinate-nicotinamide nucleotide adenylyltransferase, partial [Pseudomonadota bacterium]